MKKKVRSPRAPVGTSSVCLQLLAFTTDWNSGKNDDGDDNELTDEKRHIRIYTNTKIVIAAVR